MAGGRIYQYKRKKPTEVVVVKKKRARRRGTLSIPRNPISNSMIVKMRYVERFTLNPSATAADVYLFIANSIYDPNQTGTGHQPLGHDQWKNFYQHYSVLGSKLTLKAVSAGTTGGLTGSNPVGIHIVDDTSNVSTLDTIMEQGNGTIGILPNANAGCLKLSKTFSTKKYFNRTDVKDCSELRATFEAHPTELAYYRIAAEPFDSSGTSTPYAILCQVVIDYTVLLTEPKELSQS